MSLSKCCSFTTTRFPHHHFFSLPPRYLSPGFLQEPLTWSPCFCSYPPTYNRAASCSFQILKKVTTPLHPSSRIIELLVFYLVCTYSCCLQHTSSDICVVGSLTYLNPLLKCHLLGEAGSNHMKNNNLALSVPSL